MLVASAALPIPEICKYVVAVLAVDKTGAAAVVYALVMWTGPALLIADFDSLQMSIAVFPKIGARVHALGAHASAGSIKLCEDALAKSRTAPFSAALDFRAAENADDPLRAAALLTIALTLDQTT